MLNGIQIWWLNRPLEKLKRLWCKPSLHHFAYVLWIIILLKHHPTWHHIVILDCRPQEVFQNKFVCMLIHLTFNSVPSSKSKSCHTTPNHDMPTTMFDCLTNMLQLDTFSISNPTPGPTIGVKPIYLCLIVEYNSFPIINSPICIPTSKLQLCQNMSTCQKGLLLLHMYSQTLCSQSTPHSDVRHIFTYFVLKCACSPHEQGYTVLPLSCTTVSWAPSSLLLKLPSNLLPHFRYPRLTPANCRCDLSCRIAASELHQCVELLVLLRLTWRRHTTTIKQTLTTIQSTDAKLHNAPKFPWQYAQNDVHMIFEVGGAATNKTEFQSPNDFNVAILRKPITFWAFVFTHMNKTTCMHTLINNDFEVAILGKPIAFWAFVFTHMNQWLQLPQIACQSWIFQLSTQFWLSL